jgi:DNA-directed RNA polymerase specialized sigma24 family protein
VIARYVLLEDIRSGKRSVQMDDSRVVAPPSADLAAVSGEAVLTVKEQRLGCLERCLDKLKPDQRQLAIDYYRDVRREKIERRRTIAERLGISMNALGIRACRIRATLEVCVGACCQDR